MASPALYAFGEKHVWPGTFLRKSVKADSTEEEGPMVGLALLPIASDAPALGLLGVSLAIRDGL